MQKQNGLDALKNRKKLVSTEFAVVSAFTNEQANRA